MKVKLLSLLTLLLITLSACGGGSSSGGSDGSNAVFEDDGIYEGTQNSRFFAPDGELLNEQEFDFSMSVFENNVTISDPSYSAQAPISDGVFIASSGEFVQTDIDADVTCRITIIYNGSLGDGATQGTVQGNSICSLISAGDSAREVSFPIEGAFEGVRGVMSSKISLMNDIQLDLSEIAEAINNAE